MRRFEALVLVALAGFGLAACSDDADGDDGTTDASAEASTGQPLEVTLELPADEVVGGESIDGTVHVRNTTDRPAGSRPVATRGPSRWTSAPPRSAPASPPRRTCRRPEHPRSSSWTASHPKAIAPGAELILDVSLPARSPDPGDGQDPVPYEPGDYVAGIVLSPDLPFAPTPDPTPITITG
jgi:hypothetical protein